MAEPPQEFAELFAVSPQGVASTAVGNGVQGYVDITEAADGSLLVSDDKGGFIYRITYTGTP